MADIGPLLGRRRDSTPATRSGRLEQSAEPTDQQRRHRCLLVRLQVGRPSHDDSLAELALLAQSAGLEVVDRVEARRERPDPDALECRP